MAQTDISRRRFLRGLGTVIALPMFESISGPAVAASGSGGFPLRMGFVYVPNGVNTALWDPKGEGAGYELSPTLKPLAGVREHFQVISGLDHDKAKPNGDGAGDHARANASFLTAAQPKKTAGSDIRAGISVDQVAAEYLKGQTRLSSLELGCDRARMAGRCDSGYSCAYQYNISWKSPNTPVAPESDPRLAFDRMFTGGLPVDVAQNKAKRQRYSKSVLDFALEDAKKLHSQLGKADQRKLDEYLTAVRETEMRIENSEKLAIEIPVEERPDGIPGSYKEHVRAMYDLMVLAFRSDSTRISTFLVAHDGSNRNFRDIGVGEGHHQISHHQRNPDKLAKIAKIDKFYAEQAAYFLEKMASVKEGDGTLLDNSMIVYGCGIKDGDRHNHENLPILLAGKGGGTLKPGRHLRLKQNKPMANLYLSMLDRMGCTEERFGDSTGRLEEVG